MKARILFYLAVVATLVLVALPQVGMVVAGGATIYVPDDYPTIQQAVDNAAAGDTIVVRDGTYQENVAVDKALTIQSENGAANCVVSAANPDAHTIEVTASGVGITGLTIQNATRVTEAGEKAAGVCLNAVEHCAISGNDVSGNNYGIYLESSSSNTLSGNTAGNNAVVGIYLEDSSGNTLTNNTACDSDDVGDAGIALFYSSSNTLTGNTVVNNTIGFALVLSSDNTLATNIVSGNSWRGIYVEDSSNNTIYNNRFDNVYNVQEQHEGINTWNITRTEGTNIIGGSWLGGNYWSDYAGEDTDGDGLGDTLVPYAEGIPHCGDYLPLVLSKEGVGGSMGATIAGTTYEANTNLLAGASIVLELDGEEVASTTSDANGGYSFTVSQTGNYTVTVTQGGFTSQSKWADVTALEQTCTVDFKGVDAPYPTAPSGSYVLKCSNLWLYGASYPQGFALDASRASDVLYAWVHPS